MTEANNDFILDMPAPGSSKSIDVNIGVKPDRNFCSMVHLTGLGLPPRFGTVQRDQKDNHCVTTYNWIMNNWPTKPNLMGYLRQLQEKAEREKKLTLFVSNARHQPIARALRKALVDSDAALNHVFQSLEGNKTIGGTAGPVNLNNTLGELSYVERQKIVQSLHARLEEVPENDR